jgi:hypothetical protein
MQGLYGPFTLTERVVQKIWLRGDFSLRQLTLTDGRRLVIRSRGAWNLLAGPDFRGARLTIDGVEVAGDVEVHFHAADWAAHGHADDPAYDQVRLHVVLFPVGQSERVARHRDGREIATLVLLPLLHRDLEEYASDDALEGITERDEWERFAELAALPPEELRQVLQRSAVERWRQKVHFARLRIERLGFTEASHHTALEILGYRRNRAPMLGVAAHYPLAEWARGVESGDVYATAPVEWETSGVRPFNHPRRRLEQYRQWVAVAPDWPQRLQATGPRLTACAKMELADGRPRQAFQLAALKEELANHVGAGAVGGTRFDNLVCDGFLPLVEGWGRDADIFAIWFHWYLGDMPVQVRAALPKLGVTGRGVHPACHGWAQGLLGWLLNRDARASR